MSLGNNLVELSLLGFFSSFFCIFGLTGCVFFPLGGRGLFICGVSMFAFRNVLSAVL